MDLMQRFNLAVDYIEKHLTEEIDVDKLAKICYCSTYNFSRMFSYISNITLNEYVRKRRMTLAVADIIQGKQKIIDIAVKYGYSSPTAFNRAFQSVHNVSPSMVKKSGVSFKSFQPIKFKIVVKGVQEMNYRIEKKSAFKVLGVSCPLAKTIEENHKNLPLFWDETIKNGNLQKLASLIDGKHTPVGLLGLCACDQKPEKYFIAVATDKVCDGFEQYEVPECTWAIFTGSGKMTSIQDLQIKVFTEWLPSSGYQIDNAPDLEVYLNDDSENAQYEVWVAVKKVNE